MIPDQRTKIQKTTEEITTLYNLSQEDRQKLQRIRKSDGQLQVFLTNLIIWNALGHIQYFLSKYPEATDVAPKNRRTWAQEAKEYSRNPEIVEFLNSHIQQREQLKRKTRTFEKQKE